MEHAPGGALCEIMIRLRVAVQRSWEMPYSLSVTPGQMIVLKHELSTMLHPGAPLITGDRGPVRVMGVLIREEAP